MNKKHNKKYVSILKLESLNLQSKTDDFKRIIIENYSQLLNSLQIPIQIYCKSEEYDISEYNINDTNLYEFINNYSTENNVVTKNFYIILSHKNKSILDVNKLSIQRYLKNLNIYNEEINDTFQKEQILELNKSYVRDNKYYYKTLYIDNWPNYCEDGWLDFLYNCELNIDINSYIYPQDINKGIKLLKNKLLDYGATSDIMLENSNDESMYSNEIYSINIMLDELRSNSGRLFFSSYYITVKGRTKQEMNENYFIIKNLLNSKNIKCYSCLYYQQKIFKNTINDYKLDHYYNFTTNSLKTFFPFQANNICDKNGIYIGQNLQNKNLIFLDVFLRGYAIILILGLMNSGKSFLAKNIIKNLADNGVEVTILDKSGEYSIFKNEKNIIIHSRKTFSEYLEVTEKYVKQVNNDYANNKCIPRIFVVDELWAYINNNRYANSFNDIFNEIILEGRKKYLGFFVISQLIEPLIKSDAGKSILKTANIKFLMKMGLTESQLISKQYQLNLFEQNYLTTVEHEGLLLVNSNCVQFKVETTDERKKLYNTNPKE